MNLQQTSKTEVDGTPAGVVDLNERNWLPRHCRGDQQAFGELLHSYRKLVYTFLYRYGIEAQNRDDLFQDIFLKIHQSAQSYRPSEPLRPWLISIVLNTVRNSRRDLGRRKHLMTRIKSVSNQPDVSNPASSGAGQPQSVHTPEPGLDEQLEQKSTVMWLEQRISALPDRQREVLVLSTIKGLRMKEIATILRVPENTVKTHLRRARLALAESLVQREKTAVSVGGSST